MMYAGALDHAKLPGLTTPPLGYWREETECAPSEPPFVPAWPRRWIDTGQMIDRASYIRFRRKVL